MRFPSLLNPFARRHGGAARGQALVETALILPLLALLLVMALDFGRVFFGWVALQNAARIGADFAAQTSEAWDGMPSTGEQSRNRYVELVEADLQDDCDLTGGSVPDPTFEDRNGNGDAYDDGDHAVVQLSCSFALITPLAQNVVGGPVTLGATERFPVNRRIVQAIPSAPPAPPPCPVTEGRVPDMVGDTMGQARDAWVAAGFQESNFTPAVVSSGPPAGRNVDKAVLTQSLEDGTCQPKATAVVLVTHEP